MTETKEIGDIDDIISGFTSGPAGHDCIEKFGHLCVTLELFFEEYTRSLNEEEAGEVETKLVIATLRCIEYYQRYLLSQLTPVDLVAELESVGPPSRMYSATSRFINLVSNATACVNTFGDEALVVQYRKSVELACGFVPSKEPPLPRPGYQTIDTAKFLQTVDQCVSGIASICRPSLSIASSTFSEEVVTPSEAAFDPALCPIAGPSRQTFSYLAGDEDLSHIISGGLGLLGGKRAYSSRSVSTTSSSLPDPPSLEMPKQESLPTNESFGSSSSIEVRSEAKESPQAPAKRKRAATQKKKTANKKRKAASAQLSPNKENVH